MAGKNNYNFCPSRRTYANSGQPNAWEALHWEDRREEREKQHRQHESEEAKEAKEKKEAEKIKKQYKIRFDFEAVENEENSDDTDEELHWTGLESRIVNTQISWSDIIEEQQLEGFARDTDVPPSTTNAVQCGDVVRCVTSSVEEFDLFFVQRCDQVEVLENFEKSLSSYYSELNKDRVYFKILADSKVKNSRILPGRYFTVNMTRICYERARWFRAQVVQSYGEDVLILLIDYGDLRTVKAEKLRKIPRQFLITQGAFAIPCKFRKSYLLTAEFQNELQSSRWSVGELLRQYLYAEKGHELIKFYYQERQPNLVIEDMFFMTKKTKLGIFAIIPNFQNGFKVWEVSSVLIHCHKLKMLAPTIQDTIADVIVRKFFINKERPKPEPRFVEYSTVQWGEEEENEEFVFPVSLLTKWKGQIHDVQAHETHRSLNYMKPDPEVSCMTRTWKDTNVQFDTAANRIFIDFMYDNYFLSPFPSNDLKKAVHGLDYGKQPCITLETEYSKRQRFVETGHCQWVFDDEDDILNTSCSNLKPVKQVSTKKKRLASKQYRLHFIQKYEAMRHNFV